LVLTAFVAACDSDSRPQGDRGGSTAPLPQSTPQPPTQSAANPHAVSGYVFDAYAGGVANATLGLFVETSKWGLDRGVRTDENGQFLTYLPDSRISVFLGEAGRPQPERVQPCAVQAEVIGSLDLQIEVVSSSTLMSFNPPRPQIVRGRTLTGTIFETLNGVRLPVTGAELWAEEYDDIALATTLSDFDGGYFLCNLPPSIGLYVSRTGYLPKRIFISPDATPTVDIELVGK
jgi:hypothetical protein